MAGHSHWAGIKHKKGANDAKRGRVFSKHARALSTAARLGGPDPDHNLRLKYAIDKAKADNMPKDNIERAIKKGSGEAGGDNFESILYEGYLPGGIAVLIDSLTDNRARTAPDLRRILEHNGGNLSVSGSVSWMFEQKALFRVSNRELTEDRLLEIAADIGADDVRPAGGDLELIAEPKLFAEIREHLQGHKVPVRSAEILYLPKNLVEVRDLAIARTLLSVLDELDNNEDVQNTYANFDMSDDLMKQLS